MKLAEALPQLADDLSQGLAALGYEKLAASVNSVDIVDRCRCDHAGCVTFFAVPKGSAPSGEKCNRVIAPAPGVLCVQYSRQRIIWVEVIGRPEDRERLDRFESQLTASRPENAASDT